MDFLTATLFEGLPIQFTVWEVIYTMILFLVLAFILNRFLFQPVLTVLDARERRIATSQGATGESERALEEKAAEIEDRLAKARTDGVAKLEAAKREAEAAREGKLGEARERAESLLDAARTETERAAKEAESELRGNASTLAGHIASRLLGREVA